jgi:hypothetical protein
VVTRTLLPPAAEAAEPSSHQPEEQSTGHQPEEQSTGHRPGKQSAGRPGAGLFSRRSLRVALGLVWLLDGALQLQPFMFTKGFATSIIAPSAAGQPGFVAGAVEWNARLIAGHPALFNGVFASVQLALGLAFLFRRTARLAVVASVAWAAGVWYIGEGLGGVFGWRTTALAGAPGAALLYAVLALAAWPGSGPAGSDQEARRRESLPGWTLGAWAILWVGSGVLSVLPANASSGAVAAQLTSNASTAPSWLAAIDRGLASAVHASGPVATVLIVAVELAIGILVFTHGPMRTVALWAGMAVALVYWAVGQSFGELFSGQATDPSTGPLVVLLGLVVLGACRPESACIAAFGGRLAGGRVGRRQSEGCATTVR